MSNTMNQIRICVGCGRDTRDKTEICHKCKIKGTNTKVGAKMPAVEDHYPVSDDYSEDSKP
mgnify:FL=1